LSCRRLPCGSSRWSAGLRRCAAAQSSRWARSPSGRSSRWRRLGAVHHVAAGQPLRVAEDVLADPGRRHVGQHFFWAVSLSKLLAGRGAVEQLKWVCTTPLGLPVVPLVKNMAATSCGWCGATSASKRPAWRAGRGAGRPPSGVQLARPGSSYLRRPRGSSNQMRQLRALLAHLQHLVDLLLVFDDGEAHLGVVDREANSGAAASWYSGTGTAPSACAASIAGVQPRAVVAHHHDMVAARTPAWRPCRRPGWRTSAPVRAQVSRLPDAIDLLAQGRRVGPRLGVVEHQIGERSSAPVVSSMVGGHPGHERQAGIPSGSGISLTSSCRSTTIYGSSLDRTFPMSVVSHPSRLCVPCTRASRGGTSRSRARRPPATSWPASPGWRCWMPTTGAPQGAGRPACGDVDPGELVCRVGRPVTYWFGVLDGLLKMSNDSAPGHADHLHRRAAGRLVRRRHGAQARGLPLQHPGAAQERRGRACRSGTFHWLLDRSIGSTAS
jgi:hypothetical protein